MDGDPLADISILQDRGRLAAIISGGRFHKLAAGGAAAPGSWRPGDRPPCAAADPTGRPDRIRRAGGGVDRPGRGVPRYPVRGAAGGVGPLAAARPARALAGAPAGHRVRAGSGSAAAAPRLGHVRGQLRGPAGAGHERGLPVPERVDARPDCAGRAGRARSGCTAAATGSAAGHRTFTTVAGSPGAGRRGHPQLPARARSASWPTRNCAVRPGWRRRELGLA